MTKLILPILFFPFFALANFNGSWTGPSVSTAVNYQPLPETYSANDGFVVFEQHESYFMLAGCGFSISSEHVVTCPEVYGEIKGEELWYDDKKIGELRSDSLSLEIENDGWTLQWNAQIKNDEMIYDQIFMKGARSLRVQSNMTKAK